MKGIKHEKQLIMAVEIMHALAHNGSLVGYSPSKELNIHDTCIYNEVTKGWSIKYGFTMEEIDLPYIINFIESFTDVAILPRLYKYHNIEYLLPLVGFNEYANQLLCVKYIVQYGKVVTDLMVGSLALDSKGLYHELNIKCIELLKECYDNTSIDCRPRISRLIINRVTEHIKKQISELNINPDSIDFNIKIIDVSYKDKVTFPFSTWTRLNIDKSSISREKRMVSDTTIDDVRRYRCIQKQPVTFIEECEKLGDAMLLVYDRKYQTYVLYNIAEMKVLIKSGKFMELIEESDHVLFIENYNSENLKDTRMYIMKNRNKTMP